MRKIQENHRKIAAADIRMNSLHDQQGMICRTHPPCWPTLLSGALAAARSTQTAPLCVAPCEVACWYGHSDTLGCLERFQVLYDLCVKKL